MKWYCLFLVLFLLPQLPIHSVNLIVPLRVNTEYFHLFHHQQPTSGSASVLAVEVDVVVFGLVEDAGHCTSVKSKHKNERRVDKLSKVLKLTALR